MTRENNELRHVQQAILGSMAIADHVMPLLLIIATLVTVTACTSREKPAAPPPTAESPASAPPTERVVGPLSETDAKALASMIDHVKEYVNLHIKLEGSLPKLPKDATPEQIDQNQRALGKLLQEARRNARPGDIFTAEAQPVIKRLLLNVFGGRGGRQLKDSIMDENPVGQATKLTVNSRYPDTVPLTTVPPQVLQTLPKLGEDLEYRFIGNNLILLDGHAHIIADFIEDALPR